MPEESKLAEKLENQSKFSEEELKTVKEIQEKYFTNQNSFGQLSVAKIRLNQQMDTLIREEERLSNDFEEIQSKEKEFLKSLTTKYGEGTLDPETGVFTKS